MSPNFIITITICHICFVSVVIKKGLLPHQQQEHIHHTVGFIKIATIEGSFIQGQGDIIATFVVNNTPIYSSWSSSFSFLKENMTFLVDLDILLIEAQNPCDSNHPGLYSRPYSCASILHGLLSRSYNELSRLSLCQVLIVYVLGSSKIYIM